MVAAIDGLSYADLMDLPTDEFLDVRDTVVDISRQRAASVRSMNNG